MLLLHGIGREFESRGGIITFYLFFYLLRFLSHFFIVHLSLIQLTSIFVIISVIVYIC